MKRSELLQDLKTRYAAYITAEQQILSGAQSYSIGDRTLTRADLAEIQKQLEELPKKILKLQRGAGIRTQRVLHRD